jgi:hypothetical protein
MLLAMMLVAGSVAWAADPETGDGGSTASPGNATNPAPAEPAAPSADGPMPDLDSVMRVLLDDGVAFTRADGSIAYGTADAPVSISTAALPGMVSGASAADGRLGRDLDTPSGPVPVAIPPAVLLAGYVRGAQTPAADLARRFMAGADLTRPESVVFPTLVLELFLADTVHLVGGWQPALVPAAISASPAPDSTVGAVPHVAMLASVRTVVFSPCQEFADIVYGSINKVFDALHIPPGRVGKTGSDFLDQVLQGLTDVVVAGLNIVIDSVRTIVINGVRFALGDLIDVVAEVSSVVALVGTVLMNIEPITLQLTPDLDEVSKGPAPVSDRIRLVASVPFASWPPQLDDCSRISTGKPLPSLKPIGSTVTWAAAEFNGTDLASLDGSQDATLRDAQGDDTIADATLRTGVESTTLAQGVPARGAVRIDVTVDPASYRQVRDALTQAAVSLPATALRVPEPVRSYLVGLLTQASQEATDGLSRLLSPHTSSIVLVDYHQPPLPTPPPSKGSTAGRWHGQWSSGKYPISGTFTLTLARKGSRLTGRVMIHGSSCVSGGRVKGRISGGRVSFGVVSAEDTIVWHGRVQGSTMRGTYTDSAVCGEDAGTWSATR